MRRWLSFDCEHASCAATLDEGSASAGLLIVSGGNEIRSGAHRGMAWLAAHVAAAGFPVLRYDRRGIGDSEGQNGGFQSSALDIAAATQALRAETEVQHVVAFGNCDAATALMLFGMQSGIDALVLANPWTFDGDEGVSDEADENPAPLPASAIRARYAAKLKDPRELLRLLRGGVDLGKLVRGLRSASRAAQPSALVGTMQAALMRTDMPITILLANQDRTAMAFAEHWDTRLRAVREDIRLETIDSGSHGFADDDARAWLATQVLRALRP